MTSPVRRSVPWLAWVPAHSAWLGMLAVAALFGVLAAGQAIRSAPATPAVVEPPVVHPPLVTAPTTRLRCETCGTVEAIHRAEAAEGRPAAWVFSVRLPDGSLRHSADPLRGRWQVGDGMQLIGGGRTWNLP